MRVGEEFWKASDLNGDSSEDDSTDETDDESEVEANEKNFEESSNESESSSKGDEESTQEDEESGEEGEESAGEIEDSDSEVDKPSEDSDREDFPDSADEDQLEDPNPQHHDETPGVENSYTFKNIKKNDVIQFKIDDENKTARVYSCAGKRTGKHKYWWNVEFSDSGEKMSVDTESFSDLKKLEDDPQTQRNENEESLVVTIPYYKHDTPECIQAKEIELQNWDKFGVYQEVADEGQKLLNMQCVLVQMDRGVKACLCV